jgi:SAM-dependent methyltransferase
MGMNVSHPESEAFRRCAANAYAALAPWYDAFTEHPAYPGWIGRLERLARSHGLTGRRALDIGCGTGKSIAPLLERGYRVTGCDPSPPMLAVARRKLGPGVPLHVAAVDRLPVLGTFDYVTCLNDVANYVPPEALRDAFARIAANLRSGGVLVFDTSTLTLFHENFTVDRCRQTPDAVFVWLAHDQEPIAPGGVASAWLDVFARGEDGRWIRSGALQQQWHHPEELVREALADAGLEPVAVYGQRDDGHPHPDFDPERHTKAVWIVKRP